MGRLNLSKRQFTQADVLSVLPRLSKKTLQNWKSRGIIGDADTVKGKGNHFLYSGNDVVMLSFMERAVEFGLPPSAARKMADNAILCAQQIWALRLEETGSERNLGFVPPTSYTHEEYRRGFIYKYDDYYRMEVGRKDRTGPSIERFYSVVAIDLINIRVLMDMERHLAGLGHKFFTLTEQADDENPEEIDHHRSILDKIRSLPNYTYDEYA